jgi:hypothetical protein
VSEISSGRTQPVLTGSFSIGVKRSGREAAHSPPCITGVKNAWSYTSAPAYVLIT